MLLATTDETIRRRVCAALDRAGMRVLVADAGLPVDELAEQLRPIAIVLDLDAEPSAAADLLGRLRERGLGPVITVSAHAAEADKVGALDAGADDYLTKPFGANELVARIRVARRHAESRPDPMAVIDLGGLRIDSARHTVTVDGDVVHVTPIELRILVALARRRGTVVGREQLLRQLWGSSADAGDPPLRVHVAKLRKKLGDDPARPRWLFTVVGVGYRLGDS